MLNTTGSNNTASGYYSLFNNTSGTNNIAIGYQAGYNSGSGSNNICLGNSGTHGDSATLRLGSVQTSAYIAGVKGASIAGNSAVPVYIDKLTPMLLNEVKRLNRLWQAEQDQNTAQSQQLQTQALALKSAQIKVSALEAALKDEQAKNREQLLKHTQAIAEMKQQMTLVQAQARRMETLSARLASLENKDALGTMAAASRP